MELARPTWEELVVLVLAQAICGAWGCCYLCC